jgi:crotonobetainyl-CoA:carnitine CoA-transferase CaiB-like acyl-CoA transferase
MSHPLEGVLVVALEQAIAAPFATSRLADAGARVIKVERREGDFAREYDRVLDGESAFFVWLNRGKESLVLDIKDADDQDLLARLLEQADVFVQNLVPGALQRIGLDPKDLRTRYPRLICCSISGFGPDGPYRDMKAYDMLVQGETGLASITGTPDAPGRVGVSICDIASGMYAQTAILEALFERERTGQGQLIDISMFDALADWMTVPLLYQENTGKPPARTGMHHAIIAPYGAFDVGDGTQVIIAVQNPREWSRFCETVLLQPEIAADRRFVDNEARVANMVELRAIVEAAFAALTRTEVVERLRTAKIAYGSLNTVADLAAHPQLRRARIGAQLGPVDLVATPIRRDQAAHGLGNVPKLGEHSERIREEFS